MSSAVSVFNRCLMNLIWFNNNRFGCCRANQLAGAAADAVFGIHFGVEDVIFVDEADDVRRANLTAGAAVIMIYINDADFLKNFRFSYLHQFFNFQRQRLYRAGGTDFSAGIAFVIAEAFFKIHKWLH